jgi:branched-chain amino acid transport system substrate-binding protein
MTRQRLGAKQGPPHRRCRRRAALVLAALAAAAAVTACGSSGGSSSDSAQATGSGSAKTTAKVPCPVHYLFLAMTSGADQATGVATIAAVNAATQVVNQGGGVLGCPLKVDIVNDGSDPTQDIPLLVHATSTTDYAGVSANTLGAASISGYTTDHKLLNIGDGSAPTDPAKYPYLFNTLSDWPEVGAADMKLAASDGYKRVAIVVDNQYDGAGITAGAQQVAKAEGIKVVTVQQLPPTTVNATPFVTAAQSANPQALIVDLFGPAAGHVISAVKSSGWKVPIIGGLTVAGTNLPSFLPKSVWQGVQLAVPSVDAYPGDAAAKKLIDLMVSHGTKIQLTLNAYSVVYDCVILFAWSANKTGSLSGPALAKTLESSGQTPIPNLATTSATGFSPSHHDATIQFTRAQIQPLVNGQLKGGGSIQ